MRLSQIGSQRSEVSSFHSVMRNDSDFFIICPSIRPISAHLAVNNSCSSAEMYRQSRAKSTDESVSLFSPSQSVNLLMKCATYRRFAQASRKFRQTDRDERRICVVSANLSSGGKRLLISKIIIASSYASL